jgi:hypothetical protein
MHASELCRHGSLTVLRLAGRANQGLAWGAEEPWLLQRRTRAPCGGCWPGRCNPQAQPILPAVSVGPRDAARGSPSTTRRTRARSTRNGGLSTKTPGDARRRTHRSVRWRIWTCSRGGYAASSEPSAPASPDAESGPNADVAVAEGERGIWGLDDHMGTIRSAALRIRSCTPSS